MSTTLHSFQHFLNTHNLLLTDELAALHHTATAHRQLIFGLVSAEQQIRKQISKNNTSCRKLFSALYQ